VFGERQEALVVPEEAIVPQGPRLFIFKVVPGTEPESRIVQRTEVKVGIRQPGRVEIIEGLKAGDTVVTRASSGCSAMAWPCAWSTCPAAVLPVPVVRPARRHLPLQALPVRRWRVLPLPPRGPRRVAGPAARLPRWAHALAAPPPRARTPACSRP
jgi:membrane fusion protein (multidrug efflux system)